MPRVLRDPRKRRKGLAHSGTLSVLLFRGKERFRGDKVQPSSSDFRVHFVRSAAGQPVFLVVLVSRPVHQGKSFLNLFFLIYLTMDHFD